MDKKREKEVDTEYQNFETLAKQIVNVPKKDIKDKDKKATKIAGSLCDLSGRVLPTHD